MAIGTLGGVGRLGALFSSGAIGGKADAELLRLFAEGEAAEAARTQINLNQTWLQVASLEKSIKREVEQLHEQCASSLRELEKTRLSPRSASLLCRELEEKYAAGHEDAMEVARACHERQMAEGRHLEMLVKHRRCVLALNTAIGARLFP